jgi:hypothetical protein
MVQLIAVTCQEVLQKNEQLLPNCFCLHVPTQCGDLLHPEQTFSPPQYWKIVQRKRMPPVLLNTLKMLHI